MAAGAAVGETARVHVILGVTVDAGRWRTFIGAAHMAGFAGDSGMQTNQRIFGHTMIKFHVLFP